jgi:hypothetical protein
MLESIASINNDPARVLNRFLSRDVQYCISRAIRGGAG